MVRWYDVDDVILVGGCPSWFTGKHVAHDDVDSMYWKEKNIVDKVVAGMYHSSENFIFANDDHFIFAKYAGLHYKGTVKQTMGKKSPAGSYYKLLENTVKLFGADCLNYDTHCPMIMSRAGVKYMASKIDWNVKFGFGFKTSFVYSMGMQDIGTFYPDAKYQVIPEVINRPYISTEDGVRNLHVLAKYFPNKSRWEK
jgi:hypothetical protein